MTSAKPLMVDIGCCQGATSAGFADAGFDVVGVDVVGQPRYPFHFVQGDGIKLLRDKGFMRPFIFAHASLPCQGYSDTQRIMKNDHPMLIEPGREAMIATGLPYTMENVVGAPLKNPIMLCGASFGLHTYRHRLFESNVDLIEPGHEEHTQTTVKMGRPLKDGDFYHAVGNFSNVPYIRKDLNLPWMTRDGIRECSPRQYAEYVGRQIMEIL